MKKGKLLATLSVVALLSGGLIGCGGNDDVIDQTETEYGGISAPHFDLYIDADSEGGEFDRVRLSSGGEALVTPDQVDKKVNVFAAPAGAEISYYAVDSSGELTEEVTVAEDGTLTVPNVTERQDYTLYAVATVGEQKVRKGLSLTVIPDSALAQNETIDWTGFSNAELEALTGDLEEYLLQHGSFGMPSYKGSGYQKVSERVNSALTEDGVVSNEAYVTGYGLGIMEYCYMVADSPNENNANFKRYFHDQSGQLLDNVNYYLSTGNVVSDYYANINASYYALLLNEFNSTEYVPSLAKTLPVPIDENGNELATDATGTFNKYKIYFNTDNVVYKYNGKAGTVASKYADTKATIWDYVTPYLLQFTQWTACANVSQLFQGSSAILGSGDYYKATAEKPENATVDVKEFVEQVPGIEVNEEEGSITFTFEGSFNTDFAAYNINGRAPIPLSLIEELGNGDLQEGLKIYGTRDTASNTNVIDNVLSTGPYMLEEFSIDNRIVYKKNPDWFVTQDTAGRPIYQLEGYIETYNTALIDDTSSTIMFEEYLAGNLDVSSIPAASRDDEINKPDTIYIADSGSSNNIAFNTLSQLDYDYLWGENGVACDYYDTTPYSGATALAEQANRPDIMGNRNFAKGLVTGFNRETWVESTLGGGAAATSYFSTAQKMSPKAEKSYNDTDAHIEAMTNVYGSEGISPNSNAAGIRYMRTAINEELEAGHYVLGTASQPTTITLSATHYHISWQSAYEPIYEALEATFAAAVSSVEEWNSEGKPLIVLDIVPSTSSDIDSFYKEWVEGRGGDISCAQISGGTYDVYGLLYLFESRNYLANLNCWPSVVTEVPSARIEIDGKYYSFDVAAVAGQQTVKIGPNGEYADRYGA